jgi:hypothetical protein
MMMDAETTRAMRTARRHKCGLRPKKKCSLKKEGGRKGRRRSPSHSPVRPTISFLCLREGNKIGHERKFLRLFPSTKAAGVIIRRTASVANVALPFLSVLCLLSVKVIASRRRD